MAHGPTRTHKTLENTLLDNGHVLRLTANLRSGPDHGVLDNSTYYPGLHDRTRHRCRFQPINACQTRQWNSVIDYSRYDTARYTSTKPLLHLMFVALHSTNYTVCLRRNDRAWLSVYGRFIYWLACWWRSAATMRLNWLCNDVDKLRFDLLILVRRLSSARCHTTNCRYFNEPNSPTVSFNTAQYYSST